MKYALMAALTVTSAISGISAAQDQLPILIESNRGAVAQWVAGVSRDLENQLHYPRALLGRAPPEGIVSVRFNCAEDGRPVEIVLIRHSGANLLDDSALRAVARLKALHPLPAGLVVGQRVQANIFFAKSEYTLERQYERLRRETQKNLAAGKADNNLLAINLRLPAQG